MQIKKISLNNNSAKDRNNVAFKANVYGIFKPHASDMNWNTVTENILPITFLKEAIKSGKIEIENAVIYGLKRKASGKLLRDGHEVPALVEYLMMDKTTPEYLKYPNKIPDTYESFDIIKKLPETVKIPLYIDLSEKFTTGSSEALITFFKALPKLFGVPLTKLDLSMPKEDFSKELQEAATAVNLDFNVLNYL